MTTQSTLSPDDLAPTRRSRRRRIALALLLGLVAVLGFGYAAAFALVGDGVPRGARAMGVKVGGLAPKEAEQRLAQAIEARASAPVALQLDGEPVQVDPAAAGITVDVPATVARTGRRSANPIDLLRALRSTRNVAAVVDVDEAKLDAAAATLARRLDRKPVEGAVTFRGATVVPVQPRSGRTLDQEHAAEQIRAGFLADGGALPLRASEQSPVIGAAEVQRVVTSFARPAVAAPVTLRVGTRTVTVPQGVVARVVKINPVKGRLQPTLDEAALRTVLAGQLQGLERSPRNARIRLAGGRPQIVPSVDGVVVDDKALARAYFALLSRPAPRAASLALKVRPADLTTAEAQALGVKEVVSEFTTRHPYVPGRVANIHRAADFVDGTLLLPGETFSLNDVVGERTPGRGFHIAPVIEGGRLVKDYGGGVSQLATTTFNAMFFAGLEDVEHKPHSFYISRYPEGREATVAWRSVDLKFRNDSPYGVLIDTSYTNNSITVRMFSTKRYDISATKSERYNVRPFTTKRDPSPGCVPQGGEVGFAVDVSRIFRQGGKVVKRESFHTRYQVEDRIICTSPAAG